MGEDGIDDVVLVSEVVIQVAGRDIHLFRDDRRRNVGLAEFVKQAEGQFEYALPGTARCFL
ncbi:hypothetical protein D3C87_2064520 [compost metagenome]